MSEAHVLEETPRERAVQMIDEDPATLPIERIDMAQGDLFQNDRQWAWFERLRNEDPIHFTAQSEFGPYWSVTRYQDIMDVDMNHKVFSSATGITVGDQDADFTLPMFIAMDQPKHDMQRKTVQGVVAPRNLMLMEPIIRERAGKILDELPIGETFNWVEKVSIELTTQMLATLFDFPFEDRSKLTRWSDVATAAPASGIVESEEQRRAELLECLEYFTALWNERVQQKEPGNDLISMLAHGESTKDMPPLEYLGNLILLIVGGNDTTRNSMTGGVYALNKFPEQYEKLKADQSVIPNMVAEIIRWQTPLAHMRRRALEDVELGGKLIREGDKVVMWYVSGNRDPRHFENPDHLIVDRPNARSHLSFGYGIHRCMGNRLGEMQLRIVWEEIMKRFKHVEVMDEPTRVFSGFVKGYSEMPVRLHV
ncbi:MAG TPA: cytochrome P450 [Pseudomonadales bacterium]|nr:cytochrome P450 [Pseudomonadales bacterium]